MTSITKFTATDTKRKNSAFFEIELGLGPFLTFKAKIFFTCLNAYHQKRNTFLATYVIGTK